MIGIWLDRSVLGTICIWSYGIAGVLKMRTLPIFTRSMRKYKQKNDKTIPILKEQNMGNVSREFDIIPGGLAVTFLFV